MKVSDLEGTIHKWKIEQGFIRSNDQRPRSKLQKNAPKTGLHWYDIRVFGIEGQGWSDTKHSYARLPAKAEDIVREPVWQLA